MPWELAHYNGQGKITSKFTLSFEVQYADKHNWQAIGLDQAIWELTYPTVI